MNWEAVSSLAELVAALGGVAAVVYLAIQIRLNTKAVRSSAIDSWVSAVALGNDALSKADSFSSAAISDYSSLDEDQRRVFNRAMAQMFNALEALYFHYQNGVVDRQFMTTKMQPMFTLLKQPGATTWWERRGKQIFDARFVEFVEAGLQSAGPN